MISNTNIPTYRYPYPLASKPQLFAARDWRRFFVLNTRQKAALALIAGCAVCVGIVSALTLHAQAVSAHNNWQQVQSHSVVLGNEQNQLAAERDKLSSRERITKIAGARLQLFEPAPGQVQQL